MEEWPLTLVVSGLEPIRLVVSGRDAPLHQGSVQKDPLMLAVDGEGPPYISSPWLKNTLVVSG